MQFLKTLSLATALLFVSAQDAPPSDIQGPIIGIDLGTTYSCVGVYKNGKVDIIANDQGNRITPSYVAFTDSERLVGDPAKNQAPLNPYNTIFDAKRLVGRRFKEPEVQADMKHWPFKVVDVAGRPQVQVTVKGETKKFTPEEISAMVLGKMKEIAEGYIGEKVSHAGTHAPFLKLIRSRHGPRLLQRCSKTSYQGCRHYCRAYCRSYHQ